MMTPKDRRRLLTGLGFLAPNILGFLAFTLIPLGFSLVLAFTNWDLRHHNMFKQEHLKFVELANFSRLLHEPDFYKFLGNTLFLMMGIPLSIGASLIAALLLSNDLSVGRKRAYWTVACGSLLAAACVMLALLGSGASAMTLLIGGVICLLLLGGAFGGATTYRTLFYIPHFTSGVATFILWKKLYAHETGPVNTFLAGPLERLTGVLRGLPAEQLSAGMWVWLAMVLVLLLLGLRRLRLMWVEGELAWWLALAGALGLLVPIALSLLWAPVFEAKFVLVVGAALIALFQFFRGLTSARLPSLASSGSGSAAALAALYLVGEFVALAFGILACRLPAMAQAGLQPPEWLTHYHWAKPAMMIMGLWAAMGSNNMLLYLAGLSNIPPELYEAADIDGASRHQRFWNVTWPQLAPTTFFIVVMSVIGGLQGGFEIARTMTRGGPAGSTTTLSYFIYTEGFETGRLGYASAVAWVLFAMVFVATLINWKFGSRHVND
ncbi:sugar ABC transporter permease [bacterium]|nr:sugar ABC transporter permease [bacterium]